MRARDSQCIENVDRVRGPRLEIVGNIRVPLGETEADDVGSDHRHFLFEIGNRQPPIGECGHSWTGAVQQEHRVRQCRVAPDVNIRLDSARKNHFTDFGRLGSGRHSRMVALT